MPSDSPGPYDDAPAASAGADGDNPQRESGPTAMLNKSVLGGRDCQPGDEIKLRITAVHGDEVQVEPCGEDDRGGTETTPDSSSDGMYD